MLLNSTKNALQQIVSIIKTIQSLSTLKQDYIYTELNIGKHVRHTCDHILALKYGINTGVIDYNTRNRGTKIEIDSDVGLFQLNQILDWLNTYESTITSSDMDQTIKIYSEIDCLQTQSMAFQSSIAREFLYLINHTIHHAAHISLIAQNQGVEIPLNTGVAPCTMTFLRSQNC